MNQAVLYGLRGTPSTVDLSPGTTSKFFSQYVAAPAAETFDRHIAPRIRSAFGGVGAFSSRQGDAVGSALSDMNTQLTQQLGDFQFKNQAQQAAYNFQGQESAAERQMRSIALADVVANRDLSNAGALMQAISPFQQYEQAKLDTARSEWERMLPENSPWLRIAMDYLNRNQSVTYNPQQRGGIGGALGGALGLGMLGSGAAGLFGGGTAAAGTGFGLAGTGLAGSFGVAAPAAGAAGAATGASFGSMLGPLGLGLGAILGFSGIL